MNMDDIEQELTPDVVAARCNSYEFNGKKIGPLSKGVGPVAQAMKVKIFSGVETDDNGIYPEITTDAIKVIWLCQCKRNQFDRAFFSPEWGCARAMEWWEKEGGFPGSKQHQELLKVFSMMMTDLFAVSAEVDSSGGGGSDSCLGE
jgi:hypothetical protein